MASAIPAATGYSRSRKTTAIRANATGTMSLNPTANNSRPIRPGTNVSATVDGADNRDPRQGASGPLHQLGSRYAGGDRRLVGAPHLLRGE